MCFSYLKIVFKNLLKTVCINVLTLKLPFFGGENPRTHLSLGEGLTIMNCRGPLRPYIQPCFLFDWIKWIQLVESDHTVVSTCKTFDYLKITE